MHRFKAPACLQSFFKKKPPNLYRQQQPWDTALGPSIRFYQTSLTSLKHRAIDRAWRFLGSAQSQLFIGPTYRLIPSIMGIRRKIFTIRLTFNLSDRIRWNFADSPWIVWTLIYDVSRSKADVGKWLNLMKKSMRGRVPSSHNAIIWR